MANYDIRNCSWLIKGSTSCCGNQIWLGVSWTCNDVPRSLLSCVNLMKAHVLRVDVDCEPRVSSFLN